VRLEVVDGDQRLLGDQRDRLCGGEPDDDAADQPGAGRGRDAVERREGKLGLDHRLGDHEVEHLHVGARGNLWHDAAVARVLRLRQHHVGEDLAGAVLVAPHDRGRGLVARRLDAEDQHGYGLRCQ
jgi:hypothetical protein